jgi:Arc/MetJ-type ribon-helix-helix transcriptional regulator
VRSCTDKGQLGFGQRKTAAISGPSFGFIEMAEIVHAKVAAGEYATESEVVRDGLRSLMASDRAAEAWLREAVAPAYDALKADPSRGIPVASVRTQLAADHRKAAAKR